MDALAISPRLVFEKMSPNCLDDENSFPMKCQLDVDVDLGVSGSTILEEVERRDFSPFHDAKQLIAGTNTVNLQSSINSKVQINFGIGWDMHWIIFYFFAYPIARGQSSIPEKSYKSKCFNLVWSARN